MQIYKLKQKSVDSVRCEKFKVKIRKENKNFWYFCSSTVLLSFLAALFKSELCCWNIETIYCLKFRETLKPELLMDC